MWTLLAIIRSSIRAPFYWWWLRSQPFRLVDGGPDGIVYQNGKLRVWVSMCSKLQGVHDYLWIDSIDLTNEYNESVSDFSDERFPTLVTVKQHLTEAFFAPRLQ